MLTALRGHPPGLAVLFFSELWERFSYYGMRALLVFYLVSQFGHTDATAYGVYGSYTALVYATPLLGGWLADRYLGHRRAVVLGGGLMALGHFAMAFAAAPIFYLALSLLIVGNGFFKPNISTLVGQLYEGREERRDAGFTIFYLGVNLGAAVAPLACGYVGTRFGWHYGFGLAGVGMLTGLLWFVLGKGSLASASHSPPAGAGAASRWWVYLALIPSLIGVSWWVVQRVAWVGQVLAAVSVVVLLALAQLLRRATSAERRRLVVALVLILFSMVFWACFEQAGSSINFFTERHVERAVAGHVIPASAFQSLNPLFIIFLAPLFSGLWTWLGERGWEPSAPAKFASGLVQLGLGFAALAWGAYGAEVGGRVALVWLALGYLLHTTGELCLSPVGLSTMTRLAPKSAVGWMLGVWFLSSSWSQYVGGFIAALTASEPGEGAGAMRYGEVFASLAALAVVAGILLASATPWLGRLARGDGPGGSDLDR